VKFTPYAHPAPELADTSEFWNSLIYLSFIFYKYYLSSISYSSLLYPASSVAVFCLFPLILGQNWGEVSRRDENPADFRPPPTQGHS
jgi:hypothetical protein